MIDVNKLVADVAKDVNESSDMRDGVDMFSYFLCNVEMKYGYSFVLLMLKSFYIQYFDTDVSDYENSDDMTKLSYFMESGEAAEFFEMVNSGSNDLSKTRELLIEVSNGFFYASDEEWFDAYEEAPEIGETVYCRCQSRDSCLDYQYLTYDGKNYKRNNGLVVQSVDKWTRKKY